MNRERMNEIKAFFGLEGEPDNWALVDKAFKVLDLVVRAKQEQHTIILKDTRLGLVGIVPCDVSDEVGNEWRGEVAATLGRSAAMIANASALGCLEPSEEEDPHA